MTRICITLLGFFFVPANDAVACQACADQAVHFGMPYGVPVGVVLLAWIVTAFCFRTRLRMVERADAECGAPSWNAVVYFAWALGAGVLIGLFSLTPHICLWLISSIWIIYLLVKVAQALYRPRRLPTTRLLFRLNAAALAVSMIVIPAAYAWARLPKNIVAFIGNPITAGGILPHVVAAGEPAVPYLNDALETSVRNAGYIPAYTVTQACYCLARIGGPRAEQVLRALIQTRLGRTEMGDGRWQLVACCSYAECAGARALPDLERLYETSGGDAGAVLRVAALCGLARTADRDGVAFARARLDELRGAGETKSLDRAVVDIANRIATHVETDLNDESLRTAPLYEASGLSLGIPADAASSTQRQR